jgi:hypothetical protein
MFLSCASSAVPPASSLVTTQRFGGAKQVAVGQVDAGASGFGRLGPPRNDGYGSDGKDYKDYKAGECDMQKWRQTKLFERDSCLLLLQPGMDTPLLLQTCCLVVGHTSYHAAQLLSWHVLFAISTSHQHQQQAGSMASAGHNETADGQPGLDQQLLGCVNADACTSRQTLAACPIKHVSQNHCHALLCAVHCAEAKQPYYPGAQYPSEYPASPYPSGALATNMPPAAVARPFQKGCHVQSVGTQQTTAQQQHGAWAPHSAPVAALVRIHIHSACLSQAKNPSCSSRV